MSHNELMNEYHDEINQLRADLADCNKACEGFELRVVALKVDADKYKESLHKAERLLVTARANLAAIAETVGGDDPMAVRGVVEMNECLTAQLAESQSRVKELEWLHNPMCDVFDAQIKGKPCNCSRGRAEELARSCKTLTEQLADSQKREIHGGDRDRHNRLDRFVAAALDGFCGNPSLVHWTKDAFRERSIETGKAVLAELERLEKEQAK